MRIDDFELKEPLPQLRHPHVIASLRPWVDPGRVGSLALARLEQHMDAQELGSLVMPGKYFDFTRYRPVVYSEGDQRQTTIPNTNVRYAPGQGDFDFVFVHMSEPHAFAEEYLDSLVSLVRFLQPQRYIRIGGVPATVPHTRPLLVRGSVSGKEAIDLPGVSPWNTRRISYQGPTTIMNLLDERIRGLDVENITLTVRLPQYVQLEEDYSGAARLLDVLRQMYDLPAALAESERGTRQYQRVSDEMNRNSNVRTLVKQLEADYDARMEYSPEEEEDESSVLPPSMEKFLKELGDKMGDI